MQMGGHKFLKLRRDCAILPVQVIHERRTLFNCRNAWDIARFLADATPEDVDLHLFNLRSALSAVALCHYLLLIAVSAGVGKVVLAFWQPAVADILKRQHTFGLDMLASLQSLWNIAQCSEADCLAGGSRRSEITDQAGAIIICGLDGEKKPCVNLEYL